MSSLLLPDNFGNLNRYTLKGTPIDTQCIQPASFNRIAFSAAHVVVDPFSSKEPSQGFDFDWDKTLSYRHYLLSLGLGIAEAMDTAQRGMGLGWDDALALIRQTRAATSDIPGALIYNGCGTDQLNPADAKNLDQVTGAYLEQLNAIQDAGGDIILMASRALAHVAQGPDDYLIVYRRVLNECQRPVILHWLGDMFDPALTGYWGTSSIRDAMDTVLALIAENQSKVDGIKISLLDAEWETYLRARLPDGVKMYTGDDFNYPALIEGDGSHYSHALLGIFDAIAPAAASALTALGNDDTATYQQILAPTVPLSRLIFRSPTQFYKTGVVFMAYLNGFQDHFVMAGGAQSQRPLPYFSELFRMADTANLLRDPDLAVYRMRNWLSVYGVSQ